MVQPSAVEEVQNDLACPNCTYNLRGLRGAIINCPECGYTIDLARFIARQWRGSWWTVPGLKAVEIPPIVALLAIPSTLMAVGLAMGREPAFAAGFGIVAVVVDGVWAGCVVRAGLVWGGWAGARLSLLAHLFIVLWWAIAGAAVGIIVIAIKASGMPAAFVIIYAVMLLGILVGLCWLHGKADRWLAERCLRRYLSRG